jgi:hypothetical protein
MVNQCVLRFPSLPMTDWTKRFLCFPKLSNCFYFFQQCKADHFDLIIPYVGWGMGKGRFTSISHLLCASQSIQHPMDVQALIFLSPFALDVTISLSQVRTQDSERWYPDSQNDLWRSLCTNHGSEKPSFFYTPNTVLMEAPITASALSKALSLKHPQKHGRHEMPAGLHSPSTPSWISR